MAHRAIYADLNHEFTADDFRRDPALSSEALLALLHITETVVNRYFQSAPSPGIEGLTNGNSRFIFLIATRARHGKTVHQSDFERAFSLNRSTVSRVLDRMERLGLVRRIPDPSDGRPMQIAAGTSRAGSIGASRSTARNSSVGSRPTICSRPSRRSGRSRRRPWRTLRAPLLRRARRQESHGTMKNQETKRGER